MILYKINNWKKIYEVNRTKDMKVMQWLALPIKLDGDGYTYLIQEKENGAAIFGCFISFLEVAARCQPRGFLVRANGTPYEAAGLARVTRMQAALVAETLTVCLNEIQWLCYEEVTGCGEPAGKVPEDCGEGALQTDRQTKQTNKYNQEPTPATRPLNPKIQESLNRAMQKAKP